MVPHFYCVLLFVVWGGSRVCCSLAFAPSSCCCLVIFGCLYDSTLGKIFGEIWQLTVRSAFRPRHSSEGSTLSTSLVVTLYMLRGSSDSQVYFGNEDIGGQVVLFSFCLRVGRSNAPCHEHMTPSFVFRCSRKSKFHIMCLFFCASLRQWLSEV